uniref:Uncharacterized protein n=1 Tax=Anopheles coluzzii TaxID=1518534 RepID=A0A8W7PU38_ANOCL
MLDMMSTNSSKLTFPSPSTSISSSISCSSSTRANCPSERITVPSSSFVIEPSLSLSNSRNASRNSFIWFFEMKPDVGAGRERIGRLRAALFAVQRHVRTTLDEHVPVQAGAVAGRLIEAVLPVRIDRGAGTRPTAATVAAGRVGTMGMVLLLLLLLLIARVRSRLRYFYRIQTLPEKNVFHPSPCCCCSTTAPQKAPLSRAKSCLMSLTKVDAVRKLFTAEKIFPSNLKRFWGVLVCYVESVVMVVLVMVVLVTVMLGALVPSTLS